ncbi:hypothetical protein E4U32_008107 [Claviceps aff. humidiphila group G2b]|nr:hypothetical protein E4U32_008107 [Claviceps aff. humidiphila group G2b]
MTHLVKVPAHKIPANKYCLAWEGMAMLLNTVAPLHESAEQIISSLEPDETSIIGFEQLVSSQSGVQV